MADSEFPSLIKWLIGVVATILLAGVLFLGDRLEVAVMLPALIVVLSSYSSLYLLKKNEEGNRTVSLLIVSSVGIVCLMYLIVSDIWLFNDYRGAAWKSVLVYGLFQVFRFGYLFKKGSRVD